MVGMFNVALCVDLIVLLLGRRTLMPVVVGWMFVMVVVGKLIEKTNNGECITSLI